MLVLILSLRIVLQEYPINSITDDKEAEFNHLTDAFGIEYTIMSIPVLLF